MEFSKQVQEVFKAVMRLQNKSAVAIWLANYENGKTLQYDVADVQPGDRHIIVDSVCVIVDEETEAVLQNMRFLVEDGNIALERIGGCNGCQACTKASKS
ncbi:MAG: hypothetical protein SPL05_00515 [Eubacteriales bacterium]|nr:hypothetical protein [Eubacteriales bacterium]